MFCFRNPASTQLFAEPLFGDGLLCRCTQETRAQFRLWAVGDCCVFRSPTQGLLEHTAD
jgi:hypothetical protein